MKTVAELQGLKARIDSLSKINGAVTLPTKDMVELIDQAIADRKIINRWFGFLKLMAERSSWGDQITDMLNDYLYGTEDKKVQQAAQHYLDRARLHDRSS